MLGRFEPQQAGAVADILMDDKNIEDKVVAAKSVIEKILGAKKNIQAKSLLENEDLEELDRLLKAKKRN